MESNIVLPIIILVLIILLFFLASLNKKKISDSKRKRIVQDLYNLQQPVVSNEVSVRRDSIIKLDNLLSKSLHLYFKNDLSCGDNLKNAGKMFRKKNYNELWEVHKIRNMVVHDDYAPSLEESKRAFEIYKFGILKILQ